MSKPDSVSQALLTVVQKALEDLKAVKPVVLDVHQQSQFTDYMVIASGTSSRHVKSIADEVVAQAKNAHYKVVGVEGYAHGEWVLVDLGEVVVHVMQQSTREFYQLEKLWGNF
jgi:ribosome-associated protein